MTRPDERQFVTFSRGQVRDAVILATMRNSMRNLINPDTNQVFTEDEIQRATQPGSHFFIEADAIDLYGQAQQARALFFADQVRPDRAASGFLENQHGKLWLGEDPRLPAVGGSGVVDAPASTGTIFFGSSILGDANASVAQDGNGTRYQVLTTTVTGSSGIASLVMQAIEGGTETNPDADTVLTWVNPPAGAEPEATVTDKFSGGFPIESDAELAQRIEDTIRVRPAAGNSAQMRAWARQASAAVENAFIYPTALGAGSVVVCLTQKRGDTEGPLARFPAVGTIAAVTGFIVPPNSPVVPTRALVVVVPFQPDTTDVTLSLSLPVGSAGGWLDADPWPRNLGTFPVASITAVTDQANFVVTYTGGELPGGVTSLTGTDVPKIMVWDEDRSRFERLFIDTITDNGDDTFSVVLRQDAVKTLTLADRISPYTDRLDAVAQAVEDFFDDLGPGQIIDGAADTRITRAARFPKTFVENPETAGANIVVRILESLGGVISNAEVSDITKTEPQFPTNVSEGPYMLTLGQLSIHPL